MEKKKKKTWLKRAVGNVAWHDKLNKKYKTSLEFLSFFFFFLLRCAAETSS